MEYINLKELNKKAKEFIANGEIDKGIDIFKSIVILDPNYFQSLFNLGVVYQGKKELKKAIECYIKALEIKKNDRNSVINITHLLIEERDFERALKYLNLFIQEFPNDIEMNNFLGHTIDISKENKIILDKDDINETISPSKKLNILFIQDSPCIRNYKYAIALRSKGHKVSLAYFEKKLSERYPQLSDSSYDQIYKITNYTSLWDLIEQFDLVHSHNEPDIFTVAALAGSKPVIHDTHDLISLRDKKNPNLAYFEGIANRGATARIYSTEYQRDLAKKLYNVKGPSEVINNYISENDKPKKFLPKLSKKDGLVHIVYEGGIGGVAHRNFQNIFIELAQKGIQVHIYPATYLKKVADQFLPYNNIHYNKPISPKLLMEEMTQFDFGIIPWNITPENKMFLDSTIANKLFEYFAAGLPVFTSDVESYRIFFDKNPYGLIFNDIDDLIQKIPLLNKVKQNPNFNNLIFSYEQQVEKIVSFYNKIIDENSKKKKIEIEKKVINKSIIKVKKVLYLAYVEAKYKQLHTKIGEQIVGLRNTGVVAEAVLIGKGYNSYRPDQDLFSVIDLENTNLSRHQIVDEMIKKYNPDIVYFRYPNGYKNVLEPLYPILHKYDNIIFEHNTAEEEEAKANKNVNALNQEINFGRKIIKDTAGIVGVTNDITEKQRIRAGGLNGLSLALGNGIDVEKYPLAKTPEFTNSFNMLFVGYIALHHGLERIIKAIAEYKGEFSVKLYIAGIAYNKNYGLSIENLVNSLGVRSRVIFLGETLKEGLDKYFDVAHICIGSLGTHRIDWKESATLKTREYLSRGKSVIVNLKDIDIDIDCPFVWQQSADERPLDLKTIIDNYKNLHISSSEIRKFSKDNLDWSIKMIKLLDFMNRCLNRNQLDNNPHEKISNKVTNKIFRDFKSFQFYYESVEADRLRFEKDLALENLNNEVFYHNGYCDFCEEQVDFLIDWKLRNKDIPEYRERLICPKCGLSSRKRTMASLLKKIDKKNKRNKNFKLFCFEQRGRFFRSLKSNLKMEVIGSEYLGDHLKPGEIVNGLRHENALDLSIGDNQIDIIISNDVFEHVPNIHTSLEECYRILKPNGKLIFTVPFNWELKKSIQRAKIERNEIKLIEKAMYHKDPLRKDGALVFYNFGWDLLEAVNEIGFKDIYIKDEYNIKKGLFGSCKNIYFCAEK